MSPSHVISPARAWFASREARIYAGRIWALLALKLVLLALLYAFAIAPLPRADTSPAAMLDHLAGSAYSDTMASGRERSLHATRPPSLP